MASEVATILITGSDRAHFPALRALVAEHGGREVKTTQDGLMVAFASAVAAVHCAVAMQRGSGPLRIGLAAGECAAEGDDLFGTPVLIAERLCDSAASGEILAGDVVRQLGGAEVAALMAPAGTVRLAGVAERVAAAEVRWNEAEHAVAEQPARQISVVVADDQRLLRTGFRVILDAEPDITVVGEAADGRAAVDVVTRRKPDVVLMDIRMPELDGLQAAERILAETGTAVVMLTTFDLDEYIYEALRIGASGFLLKDTPSDRLLDAIRVAAAGEALLAPSITRRLIARFTHAARPDDGAVPPELADLTARELDVLRLVAEGLSNSEIATQLVLTENTVKSHVAHLLAKLALRDRVQAVVLAYQTGFAS
jgi:DNA-binding NarL/FixJ family response regulator